jgi:hypothetical protein
MRLYLISCIFLFIIKFISSVNLYRDKGDLAYGKKSVDSQKILVDYIVQANSNAFAINTGIGDANALAFSIAQNKNNIQTKSEKEKGGDNLEENRDS